MEIYSSEYLNAFKSLVKEKVDASTDATLREIWNRAISDITEAQIEYANDPKYLRRAIEWILKTTWIGAYAILDLNRKARENISHQ